MQNDLKLWEYIKQRYNSKSYLIYQIKRFHGEIKTFTHIDEVAQLFDYLELLNKQLECELETEDHEVQLLRQSFVGEDETHLKMYTLLLHSADNSFDAPKYRDSIKGSSPRDDCLEFYMTLKDQEIISSYRNFSDMLFELVRYFKRNNIQLIAAVEIFPQLKGML